MQKIKLFLSLCLIISLFACKQNTKSTTENKSVNTISTLPKDQPESIALESRKKMPDVSNPDTTLKVIRDTIGMIDHVQKNKPRTAQPAKIELIQDVQTAKIDHISSAGNPTSKIEPPKEEQPISIERANPGKPVINLVSNPAEPAAPEAQPKEEEKEEEAVVAFNHQAWDALLRQYVSASGKVNYKGIKANQAKLDAYLKQLADNPVQADWSKNDKIAYWINAYNAFTVKLIVDNYPTKSIMNLHGGKAWDVKWIKLGGKTYSLNNIEHDILRPKYKDARVHFAVNCAATSCPPLLNKAWTGDTVNSLYQRQAKAFINNSKFNSITADKVKLSKIFEWYAGDFGDIITYLNKYSNTKINPGATVEYQEYDWNLNE